MFLFSVSAQAQENRVNLTMNEKVIFAALIHQFKLTHQFDSSKFSGSIRLKEIKEQVVKLLECGKPYCELNIKLKEGSNFCVSGSKKLFSNKFLFFLTNEFKDQNSKFVYLEGNRYALRPVEDDEIMDRITTPWKPETLCSSVHNVSGLRQEMENKYILDIDTRDIVTSGYRGLGVFYVTPYHLTVTNDNHIVYSTGPTSFIHYTY